MKTSDDVLKYLRANKEFLKISAIGRAAKCPVLLAAVNETKDGHGTPAKLPEKYVPEIIKVISKFTKTNKHKIMKKLVETTVKTYNGNAEVFFTSEGETIGWTDVYYSADDLDTDESVDYNMAIIREKILNKFDEIKSENHELDMDKFDFEVSSIAIHISPLVK